MMFAPQQIHFQSLNANGLPVQVAMPIGTPVASWSMPSTSNALQIEVTDTAQQHPHTLISPDTTLASPTGNASDDSSSSQHHQPEDEDSSSKKHPWSAEEDEVLLQLVSRIGPRKWSQIAAHLPGRLGKQCRERWHNHLDPELNKAKWTPEEDQKIIEAVRTMGTKWSEIVKIIPGRTDNAIKNRWNSYMRKMQRRERKMVKASILEQLPKKRGRKPKLDNALLNLAMTNPLQAIQIATAQNLGLSVDAHATPVIATPIAAGSQSQSQADSSSLKETPSSSAGASSVALLTGGAKRKLEVLASPEKEKENKRLNIQVKPLNTAGGDAGACTPKAALRGTPPAAPGSASHCPSPRQMEAALALAGLGPSTGTVRASSAATSLEAAMAVYTLSQHPEEDTPAAVAAC